MTPLSEIGPSAPGVEEDQFCFRSFHHFLEEVLVCEISEFSLFFIFSSAFQHIYSTRFLHLQNYVWIVSPLDCFNAFLSLSLCLMCNCARGHYKSNFDIFKISIFKVPNPLFITFRFLISII